MNVQFVSVTPDAEKTMAYIARVSNPNNQDNEKYAGLLKYCIKHNHWSVFEQSSLTLEIETTRAIAAQILRHRSFTFQEFSQRYANPKDQDNNFVLREARLQDPKNRQNSIELDMSDEYEGGLQDRWQQMQERVINESKLAYNWAIENGIAKEQARVVLPEGLTKTRLYMNGSIRSWVHYIELRGANGTQKEHMELAQACGQAIAEVFPLAKDL